MTVTKCVLQVTMLFACTAAICATAGEDVRGAARLKVGDQAPDFEIDVLGGKTIKLSDHVGREKDVTVLVFNRAHW